MPNLVKILKKFEEKYPLNLAEDWDNVGLLLGKSNKEVNKILVCLDISKEVIDFSINNDIDAIISHHPLILFSNLKKIVDNDFLGKKIIDLIKNDISVYSAHTNLDIAINGLNDYLLDKLNFDGKKREIELKALRIIDLYKEMDIEEVVDKIKKELEVENIRVVKKNKNTKIKSIAITTGAGSSYIGELLNSVDLFITGDLTHHKALDAIEQGLYLIDLDHYLSEIFCLELFEKIIKEIDESVEIVKFMDSKIFEYR